jgi:hypothetical protein
MSQGRGRNVRSLILGLFGLVLLAGIAYFFVWLVGLAVTSGVGAAIVAASITALASVLSVTLSRRWELRKEIQQEHRQQKLPIYEEFMAFWFGRLSKGSESGGTVPEKEVEEFARRFHKKLILWGGDPVVKEYSQFLRLARSASSQGSADKAQQIALILGFEKVLLAVRADIGHANKGLAKGDLLSVFVTDIDKYITDSR